MYKQKGNEERSFFLRCGVVVTVVVRKEEKTMETSS
jgi:hypothetical protein